MTLKNCYGIENSGAILSGSRTNKGMWEILKKHKRDSHSIKANQTICHEKLVDTRASDKAKKRMQGKAR